MAVSLNTLSVFEKKNVLYDRPHIYDSYPDISKDYLTELARKKTGSDTVTLVYTSDT